MGASSAVKDNLQMLEEEQKQNDSDINDRINKYENEIKRISSEINVKKYEIIDKMNKEQNYQINSEVLIYYELLNKKERNEDYLKISKNIKSESEEFSKKLKKEKEKKMNQEEINRLKESSRHLSKKIKNIENKENKFPYNEKETPVDTILEKKSIVDNYCSLKNDLIHEMEGNEERKRQFRINFNSKNYKSFIYPQWLQESIKYNLLNIEYSFEEYEKSIILFHQQIKESIIDILNEKISTSNFTNYNNLKAKILQRISTQQKNETDSLNRKNNDIKNAFVIYIKGEISSKMNVLKKLFNEITEIKSRNENDIQEYQKQLVYLIQKENNINNKIYFMPNEIKNKNENLNIIRISKDNLNTHIYYLKDENDKISKMIEQFNVIEQNNYNINYQDENICNEIIKSITNLINEIEIEMNNIKNNPQKNFSILKINSYIKNINDAPVFLLKDSFYDNEEDNDQTFSKLKEEEKSAITKIFYDKREKVENIILDNNKLYTFQNINKEIVMKISRNEDSYNYFKNKIIREIESIANDNEKYKIDCLNILLVGRKGIGKTTLIKYILDSVTDNYRDTYNKSNDDFTPYTSKKIKYLKLIEVKGIGYDNDSSPETIKRKIKEYTNKINSNALNYNNVINCIWYCISGPRFEEGEESLFNSLKDVYKDNIMPLILVFTKTTDISLANKMKEKIEEKNIDNSFVMVMAKDMILTNKAIKKAFGKEELIKTTLVKCTEALGSDMLKIMVTLISQNIKDNLIKESEKIMNEIKVKTIKDFFENYNNVLEDEDFINYIVNIFLKYLNYFYNKSKIISNKSRNLMLKTQLIMTIKKFYDSCKTEIKKIIKPFVIEKAEESIDLQVTLEKNYGNIKNRNKRDLNQFRKTIEIFLKKNYYFMFQNFIINIIVNQSNNYLNDFLSILFKEFERIISSLTNLNNKEPDCTLIRLHLESCFKRKVNYFSNSNNIDITIQEELLAFSPAISPFIQDKSSSDEKLEKPFTNSNSFAFNPNEIEEYKMIERTNLKENWLDLGNDDEKFINNELMLKVKNFLEVIKYQETILYPNNYDKIFSFLQNEIKNDLINYINENIVNYFNTILSNYNGQKYKNSFESNEIQEIIINENIELFFKKQIFNSLIEFTKKKKIAKLNYISIILTGKSGVGKSTLINCLLKEYRAEEGVLNVTTLIPSFYLGKKIPFLNLIDTRGHELNKEFNPEKIKEEILQKIKECKEKKNFNDCIHCIWYCVNSSEIDDSEIKALTQLKNNKDNIPLIVVFTNAQIDTDVESMEKQMKNLFPDGIFISVLGRGTKEIDSFGLDELLNATLKSIKLAEQNDIFNGVKSKYIMKEEEIIKNNIAKTQVNAINQLIEKFINNYNCVLSQKEFEQYLYNLFEKLIIEFSGEIEIKQRTKLLIQNSKNKIAKRIQSIIEFYSEITQKFIHNILEEKSLEYLDMQVKAEKVNEGEIIPKNKRNRVEFKEIISQFLKDNFYYVAQKYLIFIIIKDILVSLSVQLGDQMVLKMNKFLLSKETQGYYKNIYLAIFGEFEEEIKKFRDHRGNIYN